MRIPAAKQTTVALLALSLLGVAASCSTTDEVTAPPCADASACADSGSDGGATDASEDAPTDSRVAPDAPTVARTERVLFVGNSYTQYNDLPRVVRELGVATRTPFDSEEILVGGATLYDHWTTHGARAKIATGKFDAVVLQGQSLEALGGEGGFEIYAPRFGDQVKEAGARAVWFATWARGPGGPASQRGEAAANKIEKAYSKVALAKGGKVARVGGAFHQAQVRLPAVSLYLDDQSHPTREGTLLAACTIVSTLTGKVPRLPDPPPLGIPKETAEALCSVGADVRCLEGGDLCDGVCFQLQSDPRHCGRCGNTCPSGDPCQVGQCGCGAGQTACSLTCTDVRYDSANCGACGKKCEAGRVCSTGTCSCTGASLVQQVTLPQLAALQPACTEFGQSACDNAAKQVCLAGGCASTAFGPASGHAPNDQSVICLSGIAPAQVDYGLLATFEPRCDGTERHGEGCVVAVNRYCQSQGAVSGFGHHPTVGNQVSVSCLPASRALALTVDATTLQSQVSRCTPNAVSCNTAAWNLCKSLGFLAGFGPVESSGNQRTVVCVRDF